MAYCINCGQELVEGAKFCASCGKEVIQSQGEELHQRKIVYDGVVHKCPNCGEPLDSFNARCPVCGHEIRNRQASSAIQELARKLELIESKKMDAVPFETIMEPSESEEVSSEQESTMKKLIGWDFQEKSRREAVENARIAKEKERERQWKERTTAERRAEEKFEKQIQLEKANLIRNYPIPNTKEDILEFALLVSTNINAKNNEPDIVSKAWITKLDYIYKKAELSLGEDSEFGRIQEIYQQIHKCWDKKQKWHYIKMVAGVIAKTVFAWLGFVVFVVAVKMEMAGENGLGYELLGSILMIVSTFILNKGKTSFWEYAVVILLAILLFPLGKLLENDLMLILTAVIVLGNSAVQFLLALIKKKKEV